MRIDNASRLVSVAVCILTAGPLSAQTSSSAGGTPPAGTGDSAVSKTVPDTKAVQKVQKEVQDSVNQMDAAMKRKDLSGVMKYFAPDYKMKDLKGKTITLSQIQDGYRSYFSQTRDITTATSTIQKVEPKKDAYAVTGQSTLKATTLDSQNKAHEMAQTSTGLLTWKKTKTGWQITSGKLLAQNNTYDGKPYSATNPPKKTASSAARSNNNSRNNGLPSGWHYGSKRRTIWKPLLGG